jgi:hypothetical protein
MVGVLALGFVANLLVRPVSAKYHEAEGSVPDHHADDVVHAALKSAKPVTAGKDTVTKASAPRAPAKKSATKGAK